MPSELLMSVTNTPVREEVVSCLLTLPVSHYSPHKDVGMAGSNFGIQSSVRWIPLPTWKFSVACTCAAVFL